ncbi:unnamed protein product [Trichogramma brassicae]|uniref:Uncharacterized protein n=1 Tax=Trichogramma brassicae TaxID=86971 RepID=A0A6H5INB6_9HYME|nr:unnamed protein product [Trichogramma brassicae]
MEQEQQRVTQLAQQQQRQKQNQQQSCDYSLSQDAIYKVFTYLNSNSLYASEEDSTAADKLDDAARSGGSRSSCISGENSMLYAEIGAAEHDRDGDEDEDEDDDEYDDRTPDEGKVLLDDDDEEDYEVEEEKEAEQELETRYILEEMKYSDARRAICSVCRYSLGRAGTGLVEDFERALLCSDGHLLCHRCVQKLAVKSGDYIGGAGLCVRFVDYNIVRDTTFLFWGIQTRTACCARSRSLGPRCRPVRPCHRPETATTIAPAVAVAIQAD